MVTTLFFWFKAGMDKMYLSGASFKTKLSGKELELCWKVILTWVGS